MPNKNSTAGKSKISASPKLETRTKDKDEGVLKIKCPVCVRFFRYRRGREKAPDVKTLDKYLNKAQCPYCGQKLRIKS